MIQVSIKLVCIMHLYFIELVVADSALLLP